MLMPVLYVLHNMTSQDFESASSGIFREPGTNRHPGLRPELTVEQAEICSVNEPLAYLLSYAAYIYKII